MRKIILLPLLLVFLYSPISAQYNNAVYTQYSGKGTPLTINYDRCVYKTKDGMVQLYAHIGFGKHAFSETINSKVIKGVPVYTNSGSLLLDIFWHVLLSTADETIERKQYLSINNLDIGGKILVGKGNFQMELGLNSRFDFITQNIDAWDNQAATSKQFTHFVLPPSVGFKYDAKKVGFRMGATLYKVYGKEDTFIFPLYFGIGLQF